MEYPVEPPNRRQPYATPPAPAKRPRSAMSPTIVLGPDGRFFAALGSPGGRQIIAYVAQALVALIDGQLTMQAAAAAPRHVNLDGPTFIESNTPLAQLAPALSAMGHQVQMVHFDSGVNGITHVSGGYEGGADPRREGVALGD